MAKLPDMQQAGLGDVEHILHNQGPISDYSWLDVNPDDYRECEALPKQNLDIIPELANAMAFDEKENSVSLVPMKPFNVVNSNPLERNAPSTRPTALTLVRDKVAAYMMSGLSSKEIKRKLEDEFDLNTLNRANSLISSVLHERGLLGNVYVNSEHFPKCAQGGKTKQFVDKTSRTAAFVLAKDSCIGCVHSCDGRCVIFKKMLVSSVPYTASVFDHYAAGLRSERRCASVVDRLDKEQIRKALQTSFLSKPMASETSPNTIQHHPVQMKPSVSEDEYLSYWTRNAVASNADSMPSPTYLLLAKKVMEGKVDSRAIVASVDPDVKRISKEYGILGHTYVDVDAIGGYRLALSFINAKKLTPDYFVSRTSSVDDETSCASLSKVAPIINRVLPIGRDAFVSSCRRAMNEHRLSFTQMDSIISKLPKNADWKKLTAQTNLYKPAVEQKTVNVQTAPKIALHHGDPGRETTASTLDHNEVTNFISKTMNSGLYGKSLQLAVLKRYSRDDLKKVPEVGVKLASNDGVQGVYFIDPSVYSDYGRGCVVGSKQFRKQGAPNLLASSSCTGCMHQTAPSWCNKYSKKMIRQIPESIRKQASELRKEASIIDTVPIENPVEKYELASEMTVDLNGYKNKAPDITIG
jgi:hypothetical protein